MQSLGCPLLRDNAEATQEELAAVREQFLAQFVATDLDSDRHPDVAGILEFGAKWARYCVWVYDPKKHIFLKNFLAEQMELLTNFRSLEGGLASSSQWGQQILGRPCTRSRERKEVGQSGNWSRCSRVCWRQRLAGKSRRRW